MEAAAHARGHAWGAGVAGRTSCLSMVREEVEAARKSCEALELQVSQTAVTTAPLRLRPTAG